MLYLNRLPNIPSILFLNLTLTNVVFECTAATWAQTAAVNLTLTNVVFEYDFILS